MIVAELAQLLGDPQADVGAAGEDARLRRRSRSAASSSARCAAQWNVPLARSRTSRVRALRASARALAASAGRPTSQPPSERRANEQLIQFCSRRRDRRCRARTSPARRRRSAGSRCSGRGCRRARRRSRRGPGACARLVEREQRHHEARRAEAALRAVAVDHRLLHRVQRAVAPFRLSTVKSALPSSVGTNWMHELIAR